MSVPLLGMFCLCGYSHISCIHFYLITCTHSSLGCTHSFYAAVLVYALLGVRLGLLCLVCVFFVISSFLHIFITVFRSGSTMSLNFLFICSLHIPDIIHSCIMWSKPQFPACKVMFVKKERSVSPSFWSLSLKT